MSSFILRPLFVLITLVVLVLAFFQVSGRLMFAVLDELEVGVNQWLSEERIVISGLSGDWHWWNPVVNIRQIELPAGSLSGVQVELDWLESLIRNRLVARRASLAGGRLLLERADQGWRLLGAAGGAGFDPFDTLYHSDQIAVNLQLGFVGEGGAAEVGDDLSLSYLATNRGGAHRHRLQIGNAECEGTCSIELALDRQEAIYFLRPGATEAKLSGEGLRIPGPLLAGNGGIMERLEGFWWRAGAESGGEARIAFADLSVDDDLLSGGFELAARGEDDVHHLVLSDLHLDSGDARLQLPEVWLTYEVGSGESVLKAWTARLETGAGFQFLTALVPRETAVFRWLNALQVQATALNVHGFVRFPSLATGYLATVRDVSLDGYNGAPWIRGGAGELLGADRIIQLSLNAEDLGLQFPDMFRQRWLLDHLNGRVQAFVSSGYFGLRGSNMRAELDGSHVSAGFALSRPENQFYRERLSLLVNVDQMTVTRGKHYIPYRLPAGLPEWLEDGPRDGELEDVAFAYHGQIHTRPGELARRVEFSARISEGHIQYHPDWPMVNDLSGRIGVAGRDVRIQVEQGTSLVATDLAGSRIRLGNNAAFADIDLVSSSSVDEALTFIRSTPLAQWMSFVTPDWSGAGPVSMEGRLRVPLNQRTQQPAEQGTLEVVGLSPATDPSNGLEVDLDIGLRSADLHLPGYGVSLGELIGEVHYRYPYAISGADVRGKIFGRPAVFGASADTDTVVFHVDGQAPYEEVLKLLDVADPGVMRGGLDFIADLHIELGDAISRLDVASDLTGLALELPGEFAKTPDEAVPAELDLRFLEDYQALRFRYGEALGWMHVSGAPLRGAIGFAAPPPMVDSLANELVLAGRIQGFSVDQVIPDGEGGSALPIPLMLQGLEVGHLDINGIGFNDVVLNGRLYSANGGTDLALSIDSPDLAGNLALAGDAPLKLDLTLLRLPASRIGLEAAGGEDVQRDPLDARIIPELVAADISLDRFFVGETDYGAWSFQLRPDLLGVGLKELTANLRGVDITAEELYWDVATNRTRFKGSLLATDLAEVLPQWGYAASVTTETAAMNADLSWRGSPAAVDLALLVGEASFEARNGRFLEVTTGGTDAMKIFSLVNFSTIAKRLNFDFSDVVGEGVSFDSLTALAEFQEGSMQFLEPMAVNGSGSDFKIAGTVDLLEGRLDNEMIVTLPVTKGLPWYAAYVALANPLAGLGVLVGERVLRKPLEQFSSAKYQITGTLDEPEVKFVSVWDTRMNEPQVTLKQSEQEAAEPEAAPGDNPPIPAVEVESSEDVPAINTGSTTG